MPLEIHLLGPPLVVRDGVVYAAPKGKKVWALLAYLALADRPPSRSQLVDLLFPDAEDPAGALRWNLSELRRLLGGSDTVGSGTVVRLRLPERSMVDVRVLMAGGSREAVALPGLGRELLEGVEVESSPGFAAWLLGERRRLQALGEAVLREGALRALAAGDARTGVDLATRLVAADPLNEDAHALLIRAFAATSDEVAVKRQLAASTDLFRRELGVEPGPELAEAARMPAVPARAGTGQGRASIQAMIESGGAAVDAGAIEAGLETLRGATDAARAAGEPELEAAACLALGTALVHAAKGKDEEGAAALHRCIAVAESTGQRDLATSAHRELGYVEVLRGDFARARTLLAEAERLADGDPAERAKIEAVLGVYHADQGALEQGAAALRRSIELSESTGQAKQTAWSVTVLGRTQLQRGEIDLAEESLERGRALARGARWTAFLAFPEALLAEVWFRRGEIERASEAFEHAFALGTQVNDACWEAYGERGLGLLRAAEGELGGAIQAMEEGLVRCARQRDTHLWLRAYVLDALCAVAVAAGHPAAGRWVDELSALASRAGMREALTRAYLDRRDLGDPSAIEVARVLAVGVENPRLDGLIEPDAPPLLEDLLGTAGRG
ncbi:MAG TPA: BTAD domain-containing putative transcriptional regulator [Actinomycetota bacterium]|nr:BTAD domain-containing putative transcriptional regulator [Actinomycetota bacterium]